MVFHGDRYEILVAVQAAEARIHLAHIHGGLSSEVAIDDAIRQAITKMFSLHFVARIRNESALSKREICQS